MELKGQAGQRKQYEGCNDHDMHAHVLPAETPDVLAAGAISFFIELATQHANQ